MRGIIDRKGELFAYLNGNKVMTLEGEESGKIEGRFIVDMVGNKVWRVVGDGIYLLDGFEPIAYIGGSKPQKLD